jgi:hypothetical protein
LNPEGFTANIDAWYHLLHAIIESNKIAGTSISVSTTEPDVSQLLSLPTYGAPRALAVVFDELVASHKFIPQSLYMSYSSSYLDVIHPKSSFGRLVSPKHWLSVFSKPFSSESNGKLKHETYIDWDLLVNLSKKCMTQIQSSFPIDGKLFNQRLLLKLLSTKNIDVSPHDLAILLVYWSRDMKLCTVKKIKDTTYINFENSDLTDNDIAIVDLKSNVDLLTVRNDQLEVELGKVNSNLKTLVVESADKTRIKPVLRRRKVLQNSLDHSSDSLSQLQSILLKIEQSNFNISMYHQLVSSNSILKDLNSKLDHDEVSNVKDEIAENILKTDEITNILSETNNDSEIEDEYAELLKEENKKKKQELLDQQGMESDEVNKGDERKEDEEKKEEMLKKLEQLSIGPKDGVLSSESESQDISHKQLAS